MTVNLVSPGVSVREVDLTIGRIVPVVQNVGAIVGPFERGPVGEAVLIENETQLLNVFGKPKTTDDQYEYWMSASTFLSYGGALRVVRVENANLTNSNVSGVGGTTSLSSLKINNKEDFDNNHINDTDWIFASRTPGSWANKLKVCVIDNQADQIISGLNTTSISVTGFSTSATLSNATIGISTTILTGVSTSNVELGMFVQSGPLANSVVSAVGVGTIVFLTPSTNVAITTENVAIGSFVTSNISRVIQVGFAVTQPLNKTSVVGSSVTTFTGVLRGLVTGVGQSSISVKVVERVDASGNAFPVNYANPGAASTQNAFSFDKTINSTITISGSGFTTTSYSLSSLSILDWYDNQQITLENGSVFWKSLAPKPGTSQYSNERNSKDDEVHVVVIDDVGGVSGISGNVLEKHLSLSKAADAIISPSQPIYYKDYINANSNYIYAGAPETGISSKLDASSTLWGATAQNNKFNVLGLKTYSLTSGKDYSGVGNTGGFSVSNSDIITAYGVFRTVSEIGINFLITGPSGGPTIYEAQAKANELISIAEQRKDCVAVISSFKSGVVNQSNPTTQTNNILEFFGPLTSSSYAVFDSGYKYTLDRFNNRFVYLPCNADIAGLMAKTAVNNFPWFSPAGSSRGALNNVIKLAYNPSQVQRDQLYTNRVNPIVYSPGAGFILFGDKTGLSYASAFDRINVRMLFLTIEKTIEQAARAQLFEFNDAITRSNFVNIVEPYLRDVRAKRGITEFLVICDETNNTPDVIDANQFKADIYVKPARSINFIGLTFVATRTGVSFSEIVGNV